MRLVSLLAAAGLAYVAYTLVSQSQQAPGPRRRLAPPEPSGAPGRGDAGNGNAVRDAGRERTFRPLDDWDEVDEASDESFPASDPPARY